MSYNQPFTTWISVILILSSTQAQPSADFRDYEFLEEYAEISSPHCETLEGNICRGLGYKETIFPNLLNHISQEDADKELEKYLPIIEIECSSVVREFLCSLYMPVCTNYGYHLPPCRTLCTQVRAGCEGIMEVLGIPWPENFDCTRFPEHHELLCLMSLNESNIIDTGTTTSTTTLTPPSTHGWKYAGFESRSVSTVYAGTENEGQIWTAPNELTIEGFAGGHIGHQLTQCVSNLDCVFERSVCRAGECVCEYPRTWGPYGCEETQILGGQCTTDEQCSAVTPNAVCNNSICSCIGPMISYMNLACIHASSIGSMCYNDAQCRAVNTYSFCRYLVSEVVGICACDPDQFIDLHGKCSPRLGGRCLKGTCSRQLGAATCKRGRDATFRCFCKKKAAKSRGVCVPQ